MAQDTIELPPVEVEAPEERQTGTSTAGTPTGPGSNTTPNDSTSTATEQPAAPPQSLGRAGANSEIATIVVNGRNFTNWTSMRVEARIEPHSTFMFELTEQSPIPVAWYMTDLAPGAEVQVWLGDYLCVTGVVLERHVAYDANTHGVRLVGAARTYDVSNSTPPLNKMGNHDGENIVQIAQSLIEHLGLKVRTVGNVNMAPFENVGVLPGETIIATIERYAKQRRVIIGGDEQGNMLLIGPNEATTSDLMEHLVEGVNILRANAVVRDEYKMRNMVAIAQQHGSDQHNGDQANKQIANATGTSSRNRQMVFTTELSDIPQGVEERVQMEKIFTEGSEITASITVQGWFRKDGLPWKPLEYYWVESPSLILNRLLGCNAAIYEQSDGGGTTTTLEMVRPNRMNGREGDMVARSGAIPDTTPSGKTNAEALAAGEAPL